MRRRASAGSTPPIGTPAASPGRPDCYILADVNLTGANYYTVCVAANLSYGALRTLVPNLHGFRSATDRKYVSCGVLC